MENFGVRDGVGDDGKLLAEIRHALSSAEVDVLTNPNRPGGPAGCPLCGEPSAMDCDCPPDEQMAAMEKLA
jgi:hypothetical protein